MTARAAILIVEQDKALVDFLSFCFASRYDVESASDTSSAFRLLPRVNQYETFIACDTSSALRILSQVRIDLVLVDLEMPASASAKLLRTIQSDPIRRIPVVAISPYGYTGKLPPGVRVDDLLIRPFSIGALRDAVERNIIRLRPPVGTPSFNVFGPATA